MGPKSTAEKMSMKLITSYGIGGAAFVALVGAMWLILNSYMAQADCARQDAKECQASLVSINQDRNAVLQELNKTLYSLQFEIQRLSMTLDARERSGVEPPKGLEPVIGRAGENGG